MKRILSAILLLTSAFAFANDGVYYTSGNFLVPMRESSISVKKEILTITIGKDNLAKVDVYYEFYNPDSTKTVTMAFEAEAPYNAPYDISKNISHPYIYDFKAEMNDKPLTYRNTLIVSRWENGKRIIGKDITPLDLTKWEHNIPDEYYDMPNALYNASLDSVVYADYGYMFEATFLHGKNTVHHTYSFKMSYDVASKYKMPYWLTPATRWANRRIDDFTLRIRNENDMDYFISGDTIFSASPFSFTEGNGSIYPFTDKQGEHNTLVIAHDKNVVLEWHATNFAPKSNMNIISIDWYLPSLSPYLNTFGSEVVVTADGSQYRYLGDSGDNYLVNAQDFGLTPKDGARIETFSAEDGQGIVTIKNKEYKNVRIRQKPTANSKVIATIKDKRGELPVVLKCLGLVDDEEKNEWGVAKCLWFKVEVNGKTGYVRSDLMIWDAIDTY
ncbi:MAG: SH3 domain-containing protein [Paludibacteraceae bacterium]|nr:SH3 domain-containing protein [Paludibacteraceae bacterium]